MSAPGTKRSFQLKRIHDRFCGKTGSPHSPRYKLRHGDKSGQIFCPRHPVANGRGLWSILPIAEQVQFRTESNVRF